MTASPSFARPELHDAGDVMAASPSFVSFRGRVVPYGDAVLPVMSAAVRYGSSAFEGLCASWNDEHGTLHLFRLEEHLARIEQTARLMRIADVPDRETLRRAVLDSIVPNGFRCDLHIRLSVHLLGDDHGSFDDEGPVAVSCVAFPHTRRPVEERGISAQVSAWRRIEDDVMPPRAKVAANYQNSRLGRMQARVDGYREAIFLDRNGKVSEGSAAAIFVRRGGRWATPPATGAILESITRDSLIAILARDFGEMVAERAIDRTELYVADDVFLCGSAAEITPVVAIDGMKVAAGEVGEPTRALWRRYDAATRNRVPDYRHWITDVVT